MKLDARSAVFGLVLGCLLMFALGAARPVDPTPRYQLALAKGYEPHVIDQRTGSIWFVSGRRPRPASRKDDIALSTGRSDRV